MKLFININLRLLNRTEKQQTVSVDPDSTKMLKYFSVTAPSSVTVDAKGSKDISIKITIPKMTALSLPPLYSERIYPKFHIKGIVDSDVVPIMGYRRWPLWGTVPIFNKVTWSPATMRAFLDAREKVIPAIGNWEKAVISKAEKAMLYDWPIPKDILPAHCQLYRAPGSHCYLRPVNPTDFHHHIDPKSGKEISNNKKLSSSIMRATGYIFLRKGDISNSMELRLNYLEPFDRTELDRFTTFIYKNGRQIDNATGRISYSSPHAHWMYSTASHNAIVVDGKDEMDVDGTLIAYNPNSIFPAAIVSTVKDNPFYKGVQQIKCIALIENIYVVFEYISADKTHVFDRYQHGRGNKAVFTPKTSKVTKKITDLPADANFTNIKSTPKTQKMDIVFKNNLKMRLIADKRFTGFKVVGVSGYQASPAEITFARAEKVKEVSFLAGFVFGKDAALPKLKIMKANLNNFSLKIKTSTGSYTIEGNIKQKTVNVKKL